MFVIYIYNENWEVVAQILEAFDVSCHLKLNNVSSLEFSLYHTSPYCKKELLQEFTFVKINQLVWNEEKLVLEWYIKWIEADLEKITIIINDFIWLLKRNILPAEEILEDKKLKDFIAKLASFCWLNYLCNTEELINWKYKKWETIFKVLQDIVKSWYEFKIENKTLIVAKNIWIDRTWKNNFLEYRYNAFETTDRNILKVELVKNSENITNSVLWKKWSNYCLLEDAQSIKKYWKRQKTLIVSGDLETSTKDYLDEHKQSVPEYEISPLTRNFFENNVWDLVKVYVNAGNNLLYINDKLKVVEKKFSKEKITFVLSKWKIKTQWLIPQIQEIKSAVDSLNL